MTLNTCINRESVSWMTSYQGEPFADLIFADPPFNISWKYDIYIDEMSDTAFVEWNRNWLTQAKQLLKPTGQIYVCMFDEYSSEIDLICRKELGLFKQNHLIWNFSFGQSGKLHERKRFTRSKTHIFRFSMDKKKFTFNPEDIAVPSDRQLKYKDKRADSRGKVPDDVLRFKRIAGTHEDRVSGVSTQMPIDMVTMLIAAVTNAGDTVYDPFPGSGVSLKASKQLGRNYFGTELSPGYHQIIMDSLNHTHIPHELTPEIIGLQTPFDK
jgi:DNA modification methylase